MTSFVYIKDCSTCQHNRVCKYKEQYESVTKVLDRHLNEITDAVNPDVIEATIRCKLYSAEQYTVVSPVSPWINPIIYNPNDAGNPWNPDPYKITFESINKS